MHSARQRAGGGSGSDRRGRPPAAAPRRPDPRRAVPQLLPRRCRIRSPHSRPPAYAISADASVSRNAPSSGDGGKAGPATPLASRTGWYPHPQGGSVEAQVSGFADQNGIPKLEIEGLIGRPRPCKWLGWLLPVTGCRATWRDAASLRTGAVRSPIERLLGGSRLRLPSGRVEAPDGRQCLAAPDQTPSFPAAACCATAWDTAPLRTSAERS